MLSSISPVRHRFIREGGILGFGAVGGLLLFLALSGFAVWLLPFSAFTQFSVLFHTVLGLLAVVTFGIWQLSHWLATRRAERRARKTSAYIGFWLLAVSTAAGLLVTAEALFGVRSLLLWRQVHLWTGIFSLPFLAYHVIPDKKSPEFAPARSRMWRKAAAVSIVLVLITAAVAWKSADPVEAQQAHGPDFFLPSFSNTETGGPIAIRKLANSDSCGTSDCHQAIYEEWRASAHRWSSEDQFFQTVRNVMTELHGRQVTEKCAGCHEPVSLLSGHKDPNMGKSAPGYKEGASCVVCHAVRRVDERGIGSYVLGEPKPYISDYSSGGFGRTVNHFLIRAYPAQHNRDYDLTLVRKPESCAPCHKEYDVIVEQQGPVQVETQFDDWKQGKWNTDPNPRNRLYCQQCHMYYLDAPGQADPYDLKAGLGARHRNHAFPAANQYMPEMVSSPGAARQIEQVQQWLHGERVVPEISKVWPKGPVIPLKIQGPQAARPGGPIKLEVVLTNNKAGHGFPTGPLNIVRAWVELTVRDQAGNEVFHSGRLDAEKHIEAGSYVLKPLAIDKAGHMVMEPEIWHPTGPKYVPAVLPGRSETYEYTFQAPAGARGPLVVEARLRYRKANQFFMDSVYPGQHREARITDVSSGRIEIPLLQGKGD